MLRFKAGDKVKVIKLLDDYISENFIGKYGVICNISHEEDDEYDYSVAVEEEVFEFHDCELESANVLDKVKIVQVDKTMDLPKYQTKGSSGMDLMARCYFYPDTLGIERKLEENGFNLQPNKRILIKTGIKIKMPEGLEAQVRCRSGLALKNGIMVVNGVGTIDEDFTGEIGVILFNSSDEPFLIKKGDRIAQLVFQKVEQYEWDIVDTLEETERSDGGYGHTGVQSNV